MASKREQVLRVLRGESPDYFPIVTHCDNYNKPSRKDMPKELADAMDKANDYEKTIVLSRWLDLEVYTWVGPPVTEHSSRCAWHTEQKDGIIHNWITTPKGEIHERLGIGADGAANYAIEHFIKEERDLEILAEYFKDQTFEYCPRGDAIVREHCEYVGDDGAVCIAMPGTPLGMLVRVYSGVETLAYLTVDCPETLKETLDIMGDNYLRKMELFKDAPGDGVWSVDDTSTTTISPNMFETYAVPYINKAAEKTQEQGGLYVHHSCGLIYDLLPIYRETKMNAVHALCPPRIGNVPIAEARPRLGEGKGILSVFTPFSEEPLDRNHIREEVKKFMEDIPKGDAHILGICCEQSRTVHDMRFLVDEFMQYRS